MQQPLGSPFFFTHLPTPPQMNRASPCCLLLVSIPASNLLLCRALSYPFVLDSSGSRRRSSQWTCACQVRRKSIHMLQHRPRCQSWSLFCSRAEARLSRLFVVQGPPLTAKCRTGRSQAQVFHQHEGKWNLRKNIPGLWCHLPIFESYSHFMAFESSVLITETFSLPHQ